MQAVEIIKHINKSQENKETRSLALGLYLSLVTYTLEQFKDFQRSVAFQVFEVPEYAKHSVAIFPADISNLHKLNEKTSWNIEFYIATNTELLHEAIVANMKISEVILAIIERFAKRHSLNYNTDLEVESFRELKLVFQLERILSNE